MERSKGQTIPNHTTVWNHIDVSFQSNTGEFKVRLNMWVVNILQYANVFNAIYVMLCAYPVRLQCHTCVSVYSTIPVYSDFPV